MIEVQNVSKRFADVVALNDVTLTIPKGEIIGLLGPNGAGKSTLFRIIAGLLNADKGNVRPSAGGWPIVSYKPDRLLFPNHLTVRDYLLLTAQLQNLPPNAQAAEIEQLLTRVGLAEAGRKPIRTLSKGMRQRLGLAQALVGDPAVILLDEPTNGLDPAGQAEIQTLLAELHRAGKTVLLSSHQLHEVTAICTQIIIISNGRIRYTHSMADALALRPQINIQADRDLAPLRPYLATLGPDALIDGATLLLGEHALVNRRRALTLLLGAGYDIVHIEQRRRSLAEIYAEAVR